MERRAFLRAAALAPVAVIPSIPSPPADDGEPTPPLLEIHPGRGDSMADAWYKTAAWIVWLEKHRASPRFDAAFDAFKADMVRFRACVHWQMFRETV